MQVKLLRVLQDRTYEVLGSSVSRTVDVRVISATNRNLPEMVARGAFREDLLYRVNLITLHLPALRERPDDIPLLAEHFLRNLGRVYCREGLRLTDAATRWLQAQLWPGNIRQMKHLLERAVLVGSERKIDVSDLELAMAMESPSKSEAALPDMGNLTIDEMERAMILKSIRQHGGNVSRVAASLGLSRTALYRRFEKYGIKL